MILWILGSRRSWIRVGLIVIVSVVTASNIVGYPLTAVVIPTGILVSESRIFAGDRYAFTLLGAISVVIWTFSRTSLVKAIRAPRGPVRIIRARQRSPGTRTKNGSRCFVHDHDPRKSNGFGQSRASSEVDHLVSFILEVG